MFCSAAAPIASIYGTPCDCDAPAIRGGTVDQRDIKIQEKLNSFKKLWSMRIYGSINHNEQGHNKRAVPNVAYAE